MRMETWPSILAHEIEAAQVREFAWGTYDCCMWAADVVQAMTGVDHADELRGTYDSAFSARRALDRAGGLSDFVTGKLGDPIAVTYARRGDVVMRLQDDWEQLGVCDGVVSLFTGEVGLVRLPTLQCVKAWRVE